ncbi:flagellar hook-associated protein FliD [Bacillus sp. TS-2]|nr:flagellar hook-associated protein FliD [Bacillus sp. TS-2]
MGMRMTGLASGMDIESMVNSLMTAERMPLNKILRQQQTINWKMETYRGVNTKFNTFRNNIFDNVMRSSKMLAKSVTSSNNSAVTATANSSAGNTALRLSMVTQLASAATNHSQGRISNEKIDLTKSMSSQSLGTGNWESGVVHTQNFTISDNKIEINKDNIKNPEDMVVKVGNKNYRVVTDENQTLADNEVLVKDGVIQFKPGVESAKTAQVTYITENETDTFLTGEDDEARTAFQLRKGGLDLSSLSIEVDGQAFNIVTDLSELNDNNVYVNAETGLIRFNSEQKNVSVNYQQQYMTSNMSSHTESGVKSGSFIFTSNQSMNQVLNTINSSNLGVNAFFDEHTSQVSFTRSETGRFNTDYAQDDNNSSREMSFEGTFFTDVLNMVNGQEKGGVNAKFIVNGLETERTSNTFTLSGMTVTLKETFTDEVTLSSSANTDEAFDTIMAFVKEYNELLEHVNGLLKEERHRDYQPLTDEEKEALSDRELEKWEELARSGLLKNDATLRTQMDRMRNDMYSPIGGLGGAFSQLSQIGITTSPDYMERGKLVVNEEQLRAALEEDPEGVFEMFNADGDTHAEQGIARRLRDSLDVAITQVAERAGGMKGKNSNHQFTLGRSLNDINDRISTFERRLEQRESRYWAQFNAMEKAIQQMNSQADFIYAQLFSQ